MNDSDSDDEYGPITATWGLQTPSSTSTTNESNATETAGWDSLLDPNIKAGPNDLGSGNLHRRGTNFKPIDEKLILAKRLNIQIPKQKMLEAIRQTEKSLGLPEDKSARKGGKTNNKKKKPKADSSPAKFSRRNNGTLPRKSVEPVPSTIRPPPPGSTNTNWLQSDLVDTPFWEEKETPTKTSHTSAESKDDSSKDVKNTNQTRTNTNTNNWSTFAATTQSNTSDKRNQLISDKSNNWGNYNPTLETVGWGDDNNDSANTEHVDWNNPSTPNTDSKNQWNSWVSKTRDSNIAQWRSDSHQKSNVTTTATSAAVSTTNYKNNNQKNNNIPSDRPSWLNTIPDTHQQSHRHLVKSPPFTNISRFSNPTKQRYSDASTIDVPKPVNYRKDVNPIPSETAPAPPPENNLLITINVELSERMKIPVDIRELDDPSQLANEFGQKNNITAANVIIALTKLFRSQKDAALKKRQQKLQRRVPRYHQTNHVYTNPSPTSTRFSTYSSSPAYQNTTYSNTTTIQNDTYQNAGYQNISYPNTAHPNTTAISSPTPFTRKVYY